MALDSLPLDILDALCHFVPTDDLLHLQLANSAFYPFAQRYIYRELDLQSLPDAVRCLKTLHSRRQISRYVRVFSLRLGPSVQLLRPFMKMLAAVLSEMSNLTSLDLVLPPSASIALAEARSRGTTYTRLTQFSCNFPFDDGVCTFLQGTPSLKELQLGEGPGGVLASTPMPQPALPECALPNLALYMGPSEAVTVLVPGRPLESVHLYSGDLSEEVLFALARSATPITIFGAFTHSLSPSILVCLASSLPHVHHLRIMTMYHSSNQPDDSFYAQAVRILSALPALITAELAGFRWAPRKKDSAGSISRGGQLKSSSTRTHAPTRVESLGVSESESESIGIGLY